MADGGCKEALLETPEETLEVWSGPLTSPVASSDFLEELQRKEQLLATLLQLDQPVDNVTEAPEATANETEQSITIQQPSQLVCRLRFRFICSSILRNFRIQISHSKISNCPAEGRLLAELSGTFGPIRSGRELIGRRARRATAATARRRHLLQIRRRRRPRLDIHRRRPDTPEESVPSAKGSQGVTAGTGANP